MDLASKTFNRALIICPHELESIPLQREYGFITYLSEISHRVDVLYYDKPHDKKVFTTSDKLKEALHDFFTKPHSKIKSDRNITYYGVRRLPLDGTLSTWFQDPWVYNQFHKTNKAKYDICITEAPGPARVGRWLRNKGFVKYYIYDDTDYYPDFAKRFRSWVLTRQEIKGVRSANSVICMGEKASALRTKQGAKSVDIIPNGLNIAMYSELPPATPHPPTMIFVGSLEDWAGVNLIIESIPLIQKKIPEIQFIVIGEGPELKGLVSMVQKLNIENAVRFLGRKNPEDVLPFYAQSDIALVTPVPSKLWEFACPLKLFHYMAAGMPVIGTDIGELGLLIKKHNIGLTTSFNKTDLSNKVYELLQNNLELKLYSDNGKQIAPQYDWNQLLGKYFSKIHDNLNKM